ncbi:PIN domain nuclease [Candidatus Desantisbacteria bacterium CG_4_10_14_0_8_um_filter_39_17]|uniref:PIN domain nuclease n=1 Tax=Candidatus Desantisbacteria bacterium CG_4_10_14_0_8_um_filter_39_17 TaxID=1974542 RepID=A0A2H9P9C4_9BACT|nr:MAG: PIN domain nuclease [Candidatus Desantisbacteria bacterium CG_4_10_14_0_8_um_filter_39_17]
MKKIKYYLDTSIFNFVFADDAPEKMILTERLFKQIENENMEIYISEVVMDEINGAQESTRERLIKLIEKYNPVLLPVDQEVKDLAQRFIEEGIIPEKYRDDALHISVAIVNNLDILISWNFQHIVKVKTRVEVNAISRLMNYHEIEICSPEEVVEL